MRTTADPEVDATVFAALAPRACVEAEAAAGLGGGGPFPWGVIRPRGCRSGFAGAAGAPPSSPVWRPDGGAPRSAVRAAALPVKRGLRPRAACVFAFGSGVSSLGKPSEGGGRA